MVFVVVETAVSFERKTVIPIPFVAKLKARVSSEYVIGRGTIERGHAYSIVQAGDRHVPVAGVCARMKVAIVDKSLQLQNQRAASSQQRILHVGCVLALLHPDSFLEKRIFHRKPPDRSCTV